MTKIKHGIPENNNKVFLLPPSFIDSPYNANQPDYVKPIQEFEDPKTNTSFFGRIHGVVTISLEELESSMFYAFISYLLPPKKTSYILQNKYPEIREKKFLRAVFVEILSDYQPNQSN